MPPDEYKTDTGEKKAWDELAARDPKAVELSAAARFDAVAGTYTLEVFGDDYVADMGERRITIRAHPCRVPDHLLRLAIPVYLANARPIPPSGELVKEFAGSDFFFKGAHTLPLDELARRYGRDREGFARAAAGALGGVDAGLGDVSARFSAFPRVSMTFVLWLGDEEFPARMSLLFDSNADRHLPLDVLWAAALLACRLMLDYAQSEL